MTEQMIFNNNSSSQHDNNVKRQLTQSQNFLKFEAGDIEEYLVVCSCCFNYKNECSCFDNNNSECELASSLLNNGDRIRFKLSCIEINHSSYIITDMMLIILLIRENMWIERRFL